MKLITSDYEEFNKRKLKCRDCEIGLIYDKVVPSEGNRHDPKFVIIGEAPGADEVKQERPFVGKAGQLLREHLREIGFNRKNTMITNVLPCRPEKNKFPSNSEIIEKCMKKWLLEELLLVDPKVIILLGSKPLLYVLGVEEGISKVRGTKYYIDESKNILCIPTFHPSYVMRMRGSEDGDKIVNLFNSDLKKAANLGGM